MAQGEQDGDDLAVNLSWPGAGSGASPPPARPPEPGRARPRAEEEGPAPPAPGSRPSRPSRPSGPPLDAARTPDRSPPSSPQPPDRTGTAPAARRPRPPDGAPAKGRPPSDTLISILDHLGTLSRLVTGTSRASTAELDALGARVDKAVAELEGLQLRVLRSLAGFDALRLRVQKELSDRPPLTDDDVDRIADAVTERLLSSVRVETEGGLR